MKGIPVDPLNHIRAYIDYLCPQCRDTVLRQKYLYGGVYFCPKCRQVWELRWHKSIKITEAVLKADGW